MRSDLAYDYIRADHEAYEIGRDFLFLLQAVDLELAAMHCRKFQTVQLSDILSLYECTLYVWQTLLKEFILVVFAGCLSLACVLSLPYFWLCRRLGPVAGPPNLVVHQVRVASLGCAGLIGVSLPSSSPLSSLLILFHHVGSLSRVQDQGNIFEGEVDDSNVDNTVEVAARSAAANLGSLLQQRVRQ